MTTWRVRICLLSAMILYQSDVLALSTDRLQKIFLEADQVELDDQQGVGRYSGHVQFRQGTIELAAAEVIVRRQAGRLHTLEAHGQPVHFRQQLDNQKGEMRARAQKMEYVENEDRLRLYGDAELWQSGDRFAGDYIEYDLATETVLAHSKQDSEQRVQIIIQPSPPAPEEQP